MGYLQESKNPYFKWINKLPMNFEEDEENDKTNYEEIFESQVIINPIVNFILNIRLAI